MAKILACAAVFAAVLFVGARLNPAAAAQLFALVGCSSASACSGWSNTGAGAGVEGDATTGYGVIGRTKNSIAANRIAGVYGLDASTGGFSNAGVRGTSVVSTGVVGTSAQSYGTWGQTNNSTGLARAGTVGIDLNTKSGSANSGIYGQTHTGIGVNGLALDPTGVGVYGEGSYGVQGKGDIGVLGTTTASSDSGAGVLGQAGTSGSGVFGSNSGTGAGVTGFGIPAIDGYSANGDSTSDIYRGEDHAGKTVFSVGHSGIVTGLQFVSTGGSAVTHQQTSLGPKVITYAPQETAPTLEDFGETTLVGGAAYVRFDPRLTSAIEQRSRYLVFITPQGPVSGTLYVMAKTAQGFEVRESYGHSNAAFDYRIVAQPFGVIAQRLAIAPGPPAHRNVMRLPYPPARRHPIVQPQ